MFVSPPSCSLDNFQLFTPISTLLWILSYLPKLIQKQKTINSLITQVTDATPTAARQTIKAEVLSLIQSGKDIQTTDVVKLENRIKAKLSGSSSSYTELTSPIREKLEQNKNDEWATLAALAAVKEKEDKAKQAQQNKERKLAAQEELKIHEQELKMKKKVGRKWLLVTCC